jgi:hypothetical protein
MSEGIFSMLWNGGFIQRKAPTRSKRVRHSLESRLNCNDHHSAWFQQGHICDWELRLSLEEGDSMEAMD